ncbi:MAG: hypothetical protein IJZ85_11405 [Lachnospiraceae bacterium]|nr:hypothetical protein [Lachnospiraceae bacterium]
MIFDYEVMMKTAEICQTHYVIETFVENIENKDLQGKFHITSTWKKMDGGLETDF